MSEEYKTILDSLLKKKEFETLEKFVEDKKLMRSFSEYIASIPEDTMNNMAEEYIAIYTVEINVKEQKVKGVEINFIDPYKESSCDFLCEAFRFRIEFVASYRWRGHTNFHSLASNEAFSRNTTIEEVDKWSFDFTEKNLKKALANHPEVENIQICLGFMVQEYEVNIMYPDNLEDMDENLSLLNDYAYEILEDWMIRVFKPIIPEFPSLEKITLSGETDPSVKQLIDFPTLIQKHQTLKHLELSAIVLLDFEKITQCSLEKLESLVLTNCFFNTISEKTFQKLTNLKRLEITGSKSSGSALNNLPEELLDGLLNLDYLDISGNNLKTLPKGFFRNNKKLKTLIFMRNQMEEKELLTLLKDLPSLEKYVLKYQK